MKSPNTFLRELLACVIVFLVYTAIAGMIAERRDYARIDALERRIVALEARE